MQAKMWVLCMFVRHYLDELYQCQKDNPYLQCLEYVCDNITIGSSQAWPNNRENFGPYLHINVKGGQIIKSSPCCYTIQRSIEFCAGYCSTFSQDHGFFMEPYINDEGEKICELTKGASLRVDDILTAVFLWISEKANQEKENCFPEPVREGDWKFRHGLSQKCDTYVVEQNFNTEMDLTNFKEYINQEKKNGR